MATTIAPEIIEAAIDETMGEVKTGLTLCCRDLVYFTNHELFRPYVTYFESLLDALKPEVRHTAGTILGMIDPVLIEIPSQNS